MDAILEQINSMGKGFVEFALPMLIQSSVLITILLLADFILRKKVRAVFRYWIWMLVLVKLMLPSSLSSPVSFGHWFGDELSNVKVSRTNTAVNPVNMLQAAEPALSDVSRETPTVELTTLNIEPVMTGAANPPVVSVTPVTWQGGVFLAWLAVAAAMGLLLVQRAIFVSGLVAQAKKANGLMNDTLNFCRTKMGVNGKIGLKVSANATSPAVCGLFRPVILVPQNLGPSLGASGLRAVLMHELAHIKRGDLWVNLVQTILQIIYFYNPLLWLANSIIRRVREQAVDETVQVAMGEKAESYPQILVDVAKLAFKRPTLSLRLIGVVESKSLLKGRVERMLNRPIPKSAKLGIVGLMAILITGAVLLPMAKAKDRGQRTADSGQGIIEKQEARSQKSEFAATLANGVTVELVGVCEWFDGKVQNCWKPDGTSLETPFYVKDKPDIRNKAFGFLIRTDKSFNSIKWEILGAVDHLGTSEVVDSTNEPTQLYKNMQERLHLVKIDNRIETEVRLSIGLPWVNSVKYDGKYVIGQSDESVRFIESYDSADGAKIVFQSDFEDREIRIDALVKGFTQAIRTAQIKRATNTSGQKYNVAIFKGKTLAQIRHFQLKTRPKACLVTFKNISLKPNFKTDVQVAVEEAVERLEKIVRAGEFGEPVKSFRQGREVFQGPPVVVRTTPVAFSDDVSVKLRRITVKFDQPMMDKSWSWTGGGDTYPKKTGDIRYDRSKTTCILPVKLEPGKVYWVGINSPSYKHFQTSNRVPAKRYVILFATRDKNGSPTPIPQDLLTKAKAINERSEQSKSESIPYTQIMFNDIQSDGTILFKSTIRQISRDVNPIRSTSFINSDFVHVESMSDGEGKSMKFMSTHEGDIYRYKATFNEPVMPGGVIEYSHEGKIMELVKSVQGKENQFRYFMRHWPAAGRPTRRVETYLLPQGAELISVMPEDMQQRTKDGRIELHIEKTIPPGGSITTAFQYRLASGKNSSTKKTLQDLIDSARPGGTVIVPKGVYTEPIEITKSLTLKGQSQTESIFEVTANKPAIFIDTKGKGRVTIEGVTIKWQLATSDKNIEYPFAVAVKDTRATVKNCSFVPLGNFKRSPAAVRAIGFSKLTIDTCRFEGYNYVISFAEGTEGTVQDSLIMNCGHQGVMLYSDATVKITGNIITGSKYHAVRSTGGTLRMKDNLIIDNANRGVYLGNKSASGTITNNVIIGNGTGISGFADSKVKIYNNVIADSSYAGIGFRPSCKLQIVNNIFVRNERGWIMSEEQGRNSNGCQRNTFWKNKIDAENFRKTASSILADPLFTDPDNGDFSLKPGPALEHKQGLTNPQVFKTLWKKWKNR